MMLSLLVALAATPRPPHELYDYLAKPDNSYSYQVTNVSGTRTEIKMVSQTWHGVRWSHTLLLEQPKKVKYPHVAVLYITGDGPFAGDLLDLSLFSQATGMTVGMLFDIPNQPIDGRREDDLIAHTFEEYLKQPDPTLPLLFPMVKSAIRAMDTVQKVTRHARNPISKFVVTGASKRGWTTWLVGASRDRRVKAIAPMVIDTLNIPKQMKHQLETWGQYSEQIKDYTRRGLQSQLETPRGHDLGILIDPYSYRRNIRMPTLIVKGSNDPYWAVDALDNYYGNLLEPRWILNVPNAGHTLGDGVMAITSIGAFAQSVAGAFPMPQIRWDFSEQQGVAQLAVTSIDPPMQRLTLWAATSDSLDFRKSKYEPVNVVHTSSGMSGADPESKERVTAYFRLPGDKNVAMFGEMRYAVDGHVFSLSTPTRVYKRESK
ncbi:MAG TPA: PhoPQ-activated protein PqaA family protein [Fimbriimonas sp.]|nr:PhoPQ-activated protein PqaA family protein [Fimbriimonas sp.]